MILGVSARKCDSKDLNSVHELGKKVDTQIIFQSKFSLSRIWHNFIRFSKHEYEILLQIMNPVVNDSLSIQK